MRLRINSSLVPILVSSVVSAAVAVAAIEVVAPAYAGAAPGAQSAKASVTVGAVDKLVAKDYAATRSEFGSLQSMIKANASQLSGLQSQIGTLTTNVAKLQNGVTTAGSSAFQAQILATEANGQLATLTPIVKSTAERLYDTCVLTSSLWQRSFPGIDGNDSGTTWTASIANEAGGSDTSAFYGLDRCYSASASQVGNALGGMLPSFARPDDAYTAAPPMR